jgi:hypothetical protein
MKESKIVTAFVRASDANLNTKAQFILTSMTGNTNFTTPTPTLAAITTARTNFDTALTVAQTRDLNKIAAKNDKRQILVGLLKQLVNYVELIANGNRTVLLSSGFDLAKDGSEMPILGDIINFTLKDGMAQGSVVSECNGVANVVSYIHGYTADPYSAASVWTEEFSTSASFTHINLQSGQKYWFRIKAMGRNGQFAISNAVPRLVQ